jgi:hypothetical protein
MWKSETASKKDRSDGFYNFVKEGDGILLTYGQCSILGRRPPHPLFFRKSAEATEAKRVPQRSLFQEPSHAKLYVWKYKDLEPVPSMKTNGSRSDFRFLPDGSQKVILDGKILKTFTLP